MKKAILYEFYYEFKNGLVFQFHRGYYKEPKRTKYWKQLGQMLDADKIYAYGFKVAEKLDEAGQ